MERKSNLKSIGHNIQLARLKKGFTQEVLAEKCNVSAKYISALETGLSAGSIPLIIDICNILDITPNYIFDKALNINKEASLANFYFGDYYYKRNDYKKALYHYKIAYNNGVAKTYDFNLKLATIYEKLADLSNAKKFYEISYNIKADSKVKEKIQLLNELNYDKSDYYHNIRE